MRGGKGGGGRLSGKQRPRPSLCPAGQGWVTVGRGLAGSLVSGGPGPAEGAGEGHPKERRVGRGVHIPVDSIIQPSRQAGQSTGSPSHTASCMVSHFPRERPAKNTEMLEENLLKKHKTRRREEFRRSRGNTGKDKNLKPLQIHDEERWDYAEKELDANKMREQEKDLGNKYGGKSIFQNNRSAER